MRRTLAAGLSALVFPLMMWAQAPPPRAVSLRASTVAQQLPLDQGAKAVWQSLQKLHTRASLIMFTAHPDDEDSGLLVYESRGQGARVALLTLNRGEGGQNLKTGDFYDALGLIRTQELLAADRYYGVQQFFTRVIDFGFSKTEQETLAQWGHQRVLADAVRVVRMTRPLVVTSVFVGGPSDGHGNHAAAGELAQEAYNDAGDPKMFPDQIKAGLLPWTPLKVYARVPVNAFTARGIYDSASQVYTPNRIFDYVHQSWIDGQPSITVRIPSNSADAQLDTTFNAIASQGREQHRSQFNFSGRGGAPGRGRGGPGRGGASGTPYHLYAERVTSTAPETSMFDGIDTSLIGIADLANAPQSAESQALRSALAAINGDVETAIHDFSAASPDRVAPPLAQGLAATNALIAQVDAGHFTPEAKYNILHELKVKQTQFNDAIVEALGLGLSATTPAADAVPGQRLTVTAKLTAGAEPVQIDTIDLAGASAGTAPDTGAAPWTTAAAGHRTSTLAAGASRTAAFQVSVPADAHLTRPYFSRTGTEQPYYNITDPRFLNLPQMPYPLAAWAHLTYRGVPLEFGQVVQTAAAGASEPLNVTPAISVSIDPKIGIMPLPAKPFALTVSVETNRDGGATGSVRLRLPSGWTATPASSRFSLSRPGASVPVNFEVTPTAASSTSPQFTITAVASANGHSYAEGYRTVAYTGLVPSNYYTAATYRTRGVNVQVASGLNIGYVAGSGDAVNDSLANLGVTVHTIAPADLATANLAAYNVIVLGIRTYDVVPAVRDNNARLLDYVRNGGVLIVQYQSSAFDRGFGPFPYTLGGNGATVVDEKSAVDILAPANPVLSWPNKITAADFQGWIEERGHGFMAGWDSHYLPLLSMHDADQPPQRGGLLYATYGKGVYVYEGLALYRQLAEGVPGGYRIFANLISLPKRTIK
jgi:LmbE family N-acetylglucosaminyl deacetylase